jgi:hypothetical protein
MLVLLLPSLLGCTPHDADVKGEYFVWLAANTSPTVQEGLVPLDDATRIDCVRGWDDEDNDWVEGYIGPRQGEIKQGTNWSEKYIGGDCAPTDTDCLAVYKELRAPCEQIDELRVHQFLQKDGFYAFREDLDPWRTEVVMNSEGDFQLAVHHKLPGGEDFRVVMSIAADYAPIECTADENGNTVAQYIDGSDWLDEWSLDQPDVDGTIYYLNGGAVQHDPDDITNYWFLPSQWLAGVSNAKLSSEIFWSHPTDYGVYYEDELANPPEFIPDPHFLIGEGDHYMGSVGDYTGDGKDDPAINNDEFDNDNPEHVAYHELFVQAVEDLTHGGEFDDSSDLNYDQEIADVAGADYTDGTEFVHRVEGNLWRPVDHTTAGLDGWAEVHSSWVIIDSGSDLEEGGSASGSFQIMFDGALSQSAILVHGTFKTDNIKRDPWGYPDLVAELRDENDMPFCSGLAAQ